jgi:transcription initiation factor TFIIIB Brf1 subunit/transcription initiation factor TFIIB
MPPKERSLNNDLNKIRSICKEASLLNCIEDDSKLLYKIASENKSEKNTNIIIRGSNRIGLIAACIFYACKRRGYTKNHKEIAKLCNITPPLVNRGCKKFIQCVKYKNIDYNTNISRPINYIKHFCEKLKIPDKYINYITEITEKIQKINIEQSHKPISIAAACILLCIKQLNIENIDKHKISSILDISEVTLYKAYEKLLFKKNIIFDIKPEKKIQNNINEKDIPKHFIERLEEIKKINLQDFSNLENIKIYKFINCDYQKYIIENINECLIYTKNNK